MSQESLSLSIRLRHASITPDQISLSMGVQPTAIHAVGTSRKSPAGKELGGTYAETYWAHQLLRQEDAELEKAIANANAWLDKRQDFLKGFLQSGGSIQYYVSVSCADRFAAELTPKLLERCTHIGVSLSIEVFSG